MFANSARSFLTSSQKENESETRLIPTTTSYGITSIYEAQGLSEDLDFHERNVSFEKSVTSRLSTDSFSFISPHVLPTLSDLQKVARSRISSLPAVPIDLVNYEFELGDHIYCVHSTSTSEVILSLGSIVREDVRDTSLDLFVVSPPLDIPITEVDFLLSLAHAEPSSNDILVVVSSSSIVSRRPIFVPKPVLDFPIIQSLLQFYGPPSPSDKDYIATHLPLPRIPLPYYSHSWLIDNFPVVNGTTNLCLDCSDDPAWVCICPHIFSSLYHSVYKSPNFAPLFDFLYPRLWKHLHFAGVPPPFDITTPYTRIVLAHVIRTFSPDKSLQYDTIERWITYELGCLSSTHSFEFEAQAAQDLIDNSTHLFNSIISFLGDCAMTPLYLISDFVSYLKDYILTTALSFGFAVVMAGVGKLVLTFLKKVSHIKDSLVDFMKSHATLLELFCKVLIRHLYDYSLEHQLLELALVGLTVDNVLYCCGSNEWKAQADVDPFVGILSILFGTLTAALSVSSHKNAHCVSRLIGGAMLSITAFDRADVWRKLLALHAYLSGNVADATIESYRQGKTACAIDFYDYFVKVSSTRESLTVDQKNLLGSLYNTYLNHTTQYTKEQMSVLSTLLRPAIEFVKANQINRVQQYRRVPDVFAFHGEPGIGKSTIINHLLEQITFATLKTTDVGKLVYTLNPNDQYASCYSQQDIWRSDEMFAEKDGDTAVTQSPFISYIYKLCTPSPQTLNMAAIEEKGTYLRASLVIGATNLPLQQAGCIQTVVKSVHFPTAVNDRVNFRVQPILQKEFGLKNRSIILKLTGLPVSYVHPRDLYSFIIRDCNSRVYTREELHLPPSENKMFTYDELLNLMLSSYMACRCFEPMPFKSDITNLEAIRKRVSDISFGRVTDLVIHTQEEEGEDLPPSHRVDDDIPSSKEEEVEIIDPDDLYPPQALNHSYAASSSSEFTAEGWSPFSWFSRPPTDTKVEWRDANGEVINDFLYIVSDIEFCPAPDIMPEKPFQSLAYKFIESNDEIAVQNFCYVRRLRHLTPAILCASAFSVLLVAFGIYRAKRKIRPPEWECNLDTVDQILHNYTSSQSAPQEEKKFRYRQYNGQASTSPWLSIGNTRGHLFFERISSQLFSLTSTTGHHICDVLALNGTTLMGPGHILSNLTLFSLRGRQNGNPFQRDFNSSDFILSDKTIGVDCALLTLHKPLPHTRTITSYINRSGACVGSTVRIFRDSLGDLRVDLLTATDSIGRVQYKHNDNLMTLPYGDYREGEGSTFQGLCGAVYLTLSQSEDEQGRGGLLFGMHVAGKEKENRWVCTMIKRSLVEVAIPGNCQPAIFDNGTGPISKSGLASEKCTSCVPLINKARLGQVLAMPYSGAYMVSLLYPAITSNGLTTPTQKFMDALHKLPIANLPDLKFACRELVQRLLVLAPVIDKSETTYLAIIGGTDFTGSIDRSTSPGIPFTDVGHKKGNFCLTDVDVDVLGIERRIVPNNALLDIVQQHEMRLLSGVESPAVGAVSLKEEPRLKEKVLAGNTRVYTVCPLHENILLKRWFIRSLRTISFGWRHHSGMNDFDNEGKYIHDQIRDELIRQSEIKFDTDFELFVIASDFRNYDLSFTPEVMEYVSYVLRCIEVGKLLPSEYLFNYDPKNIQDKLRFTLMKRSVNFLVQSNFEMFESKGNPSGGALTSLINYIGSFLAFTYAFACCPDVLWYPLLTGDDSFIMISLKKGTPFPVQQWTNRIKECGFDITNDAKTGDPELLPLFNENSEKFSQYSFMSHHFTKTQCILAPDRLSRILPFQKAGKERDCIAACLDSVRRYSIPYYKDDLLDLIPEVLAQVKFCGFDDFEEFLTLTDFQIKERFFLTYSKDYKIFQAFIPDYNVKAKDPKILQLPNLEEVFEAQGDDGVDEAAFADSETVVEEASELCNLPFLEQHIPSHELAVPGRFGRPYLFTSFDTGTTFPFYSYPALTSYFYNQPYCKMGIFNKVFLRATVCLKIVVSTSPFIYGRIMLAAIAGDYQPASLYEMSGYPNVELDLSSACEAVIKFPMLTPSNWALIDVLNTGGAYNYLFDYGTLVIAPMTPLSQSVRASIYIWLEDVQLRGSTISSWAVAEGKEEKGKAKEKPAKEKSKAGGSSSYPSAEVITAASQARMSEKKQGWLMEHTPGWAAKTQATVTAIGESVECIASSILGPLGEFTEASDDFVKNIAPAIPAMVGLSAPACDTHLTPMIIMSGNQTAHMIGEVATVKLGASQLTRIVSPSMLFNKDYDEMDIYMSVKDFGLMKVLTWDPTSASGSSLYHFRVNPGLYHAPVPGVFPQTAQVTRLAYIASLFRLWRGTLRYKFSIPKTAFQTGVLEFVYQSGIGTVANNIDNNGALSRVLWDVSKQSTIVIDIPYNALTAFSPVIMQAFSEDPIANSSSTTGAITINVVNPLVDASGLVPGSVKILLYVAGGSDIEFARPGIDNQTIVYPQFPSIKPALLEDTFIAQGGDLYQDNEVDSSHTLVTANKSGMFAHLSTVGERIINLRLLCKRMPYKIPYSYTGTAFPDLTFERLLITNQMMNAICQLYAYRTGGWRLGTFFLPSLTTPVFVSTHFNGKPSPFDPGYVFYPVDIAGPKVLDIPYTNIVPFKTMFAYSTNYPDPVSVSMSNYDATYFQVACFMCGADDFNLGCQIGAKALLVNSAWNEQLF
jgi:hypothetical protein